MLPSFRVRHQLLNLLWRPAVISLPFAAFFGTLFGSSSWPSYVLAYKISAVFSYTISAAMVALEGLVFPGLCGRLGTRQPHYSIIMMGYTATALIGSFAAGTIVHFTLRPGFMGSGRAVLINGMFALLFTGLFGGIISAIQFYRSSVERARAVEQMRAELAQAELRALRAQINPHFLFNTLNTIAALIVENPRMAEDVTTRLAEVFRYTLKTSDQPDVPFGDELQFMRNYLTIERIRFGDRLRFEETVEPGLDSVRVPSLLLQPIVENAVRYGVSSRPEGGTLNLAARRDDGRIVIEVSDDGPGFRAHEQASGMGFGLHSVRERLRAAGHAEGLTIESAPGQGTRVRVTLPLAEPSLPPLGTST